MPSILATTVRRAPVPGSTKAEPLVDQPSLDEWIIGQLEQRGFQALEQLAASLRPVNWSELFLALDRLNRSGKIVLWPASNGDVVLSLHGRERMPSFAKAS
jgi:hypothetical protein